MEHAKEAQKNYQYDSVVYFLELGLAQHGASNDHEMMSSIYFDLGQAYSKMGRYNKGTSYQRASIEEKEIIGDSVGIGLSLNHIGFNYHDLGMLDSAIVYYKKSMAFREAINDEVGRAWNLNNIGIVFEDQGEIENAKKYHNQALKIRESIDDMKGVAASLSNLAILYFRQGNHVMAVDYLHRVLKIVDKNEDMYQRANALQNLSTIYSGQGDFEKSLEYEKEVLKLREELGDLRMTLSTMGNIAAAYSNLDMDKECIEYCHRIIKRSRYEGMEAYSGMAYYLLSSVYLRQHRHDSALYWIWKDPALLDYKNHEEGTSRVLVLGRIYADQGRHDLALNWFNKGMELTSKTKDVRDIKLLTESMYETYKEVGNKAKALEMLELHNFYRDSINSENNQRSLIEMQYQYQYEKAALTDSINNAKAVEIKNAQIAQRDAEIKAKKNQQYGLFGGLGLMLILAVVFFTQRNSIAFEKDRSDKLLLNILPRETAEELKSNGSSEARLYNDVTVLFTDFKGFTELSESLTPQELVKDLHECFSAFDNILEKYNIEKIKTIGDAYMAAAGLPISMEGHAKNMVLAAFEMRDFIEKGKQAKKAKGLPFFEIRIGIHSGPVVAGIVGIKKFQFDIWGDTVNTASRMESSGAVGAINISQSTFERIKDDKDLTFHHRGKIKAKGKGEIEMYFVT